MESSTLIPVSLFSFFLPKPHNRTLIRRNYSTTIQCNKMYVPGFGEASPEAKAAKHLHDFFTYVAVRIVNAQLEVPPLLLLPVPSPFPSPSPSPWMNFILSWLTEQSYNREAHAELMEFLETHSLKDGDKFCADLMRESPRHKTLALRILEVRSAYCKNDFEWDNLKRLASKMVDDHNTRLMRDYVLETSHEES